MDYTVPPSDENPDENLDSENFLTKEELIKQLEVSGVNLGNDPATRVDTYVNAGLLPIPQVGHFPTWTLQRIIAIENKLAAGESLADIQKEVQKERRQFLSGVKDLNSLVTLYKKFQKNSAFFLFSFLLLFILGTGVFASSIVFPGNPVAVAGEYTMKTALDGAGKVAKVAAAPVGKTLVVFIQASKPEDTKSADPLNLTNIEAANPVASADLVQLDESGNIDISGQVMAAGFSGSGENLTNLPASEVIGELELASLPWSSVTSQPTVLSSIDSVSNDEGNIDLVAGTGISILSDDSLDTITISNTATYTDTGSAQFIFKNIAAAGQSTVAADINNDTLTLIAGANLVITTDAGGNSVTFSVTGTVANADTLDLLDSSQFLRSDTSDSFTSGTLTIAVGTTLDVLGTFTCTDCIGDAAVVDTLTASNYLPLAGGTMAGAINLNNNLLLNIGNAGTDFDASGGLTLAGTETLSALSISSGSRVANTITFNPAAGGSQHGYNLAITNAPTVSANTAYGYYVNQTDTTTFANTNYGVYSTVTHTGPIAGSINTYGGYFNALGDTGGTSTAYGVYGVASNADNNYGVYGFASDPGLPLSYGVYGSGSDYGVYGYSASGVGTYGSSGNTGVYGLGGIYGVYGFAATGVYGYGSTYGVQAFGGSNGTGLYVNGGVYGVYNEMLGPRTATVYLSYLSNAAASSTAGIDKYGLYITSTGSWNGAGSNNYALYIADPTGGTANYAIYQAGTTGLNILNANTRIGGTTTPTVALDVTGQIQTTSTLTFSGAIATDITTTANNSLDIAPNGTGGINFTSGATTGKAFTFNANSVTSGDGFGVTVNSLTGGFGFYVTAVGSNSNVRTGAIAAIQTGRIYTGLSATDTGSVLEVDRLPAINSAGQILTLSGPLLGISEFYDMALSGTITHANPLVKIDAQNTSSQPIMIITTSGTQDLLKFEAIVLGTISNGIVFSALGPTVITDAIDVSDTEIVNAINVGDNTVLGTTANLDFTYFDVAGTDGTITAGVSTTTHTLTGMLCIRNATACPAQAAGRLYVDTAGTAAGDDPGDVFDIAEYFPATEAVEPGDVLIADSNQAKALRRSSESYQGSLIGIVSTTPAATIDEGFFSIGANKFDPTHPYVALAGRVPTKVSTENGSIQIGDPLTSSTTAGVAMKATSSGPIIGKALEAYSGSGTGKIMVFISVGWYVAPVAQDLGSMMSDLSDINIETLAAGTINTQVLFVGERKISMEKDGALKIEGNVEITGSLIAGKISTDELVISEKSSGSANVKAGVKEVTVDNVLVKETSKVLVTFTTGYSPANRYYVTKEKGKSFTIHLDQPPADDAAFDWLIIN